MFRQTLNRVHKTLTQGRKSRSRKGHHPRRSKCARLAVEGLEERALLTTLEYGIGSVMYTQDALVADTLTFYYNQATHRNTLVDAYENITLAGNFPNPPGNHTSNVSFGGTNIPGFTFESCIEDCTYNIEGTAPGTHTNV
jgi:hypothetical protein